MHWKRKVPEHPSKWRAIGIKNRLQGFSRPPAKGALEFGDLHDRDGGIDWSSGWRGSCGDGKARRFEQDPDARLPLQGRDEFGASVCCTLESEAGFDLFEGHCLGKGPVMLLTTPVSALDFLLRDWRKLGVYFGANQSLDRDASAGGFTPQESVENDLLKCLTLELVLLHS